MTIYSCLVAGSSRLSFSGKLLQVLGPGRLGSLMQIGPRFYSHVLFLGPRAKMITAIQRNVISGQWQDSTIKPFQASVCIILVTPNSELTRLCFKAKHKIDVQGNALFSLRCLGVSTQLKSILINHRSK